MAKKKKDNPITITMITMFFVSGKFFFFLGKLLFTVYNRLPEKNRDINGKSCFSFRQEKLSDDDTNAELPKIPFLFLLIGSRVLTRWMNGNKLYTRVSLSCLLVCSLFCCLLFCLITVFSFVRIIQTATTMKTRFFLLNNRF